MEDSANCREYLKKLREDSEKEEQSFTKISEFLEKKAREKGTPIRGQFELTPLCNLNCRMCYVHLSKDQLHGCPLLTVNEWKNLILQAWKAGMFQATLTGGECLTYPGFEEIFLYLHSLGCEVDVMTNGLLLDDKWISFFRKHQPASIQITLYGSNDDVYERVTGYRVFHQVIENVRRVQEAELPLLLSITPSKFLGEDALETLRIAYSMSNRVFINSMLFKPQMETGRSEEEAEADLDLYTRIFRMSAEMRGRKTAEFYDGDLPEPGGPCHECDKKGVKCGGGKSGFVINWKGEILPCNRLDMLKGYPLRDGFEAAWAQIHRGAENWPRVPECEGCPYEMICSHCAANMLRFADPGQFPAKLCERTMHFVRQGVWELPDCE